MLVYMHLAAVNRYIVHKLSHSGTNTICTFVGVRCARHLSSASMLPDTHQMLRKSLRDFSDNELIPIAGQLDRNHTYPKDQVT